MVQALNVHFTRQLEKHEDCPYVSMFQLSPQALKTKLTSTPKILAAWRYEIPSISSHFVGT
jgi:hypothetical protein